MDSIYKKVAYSLIVAVCFAVRSIDEFFDAREEVGDADDLNVPSKKDQLETELQSRLSKMRSKMASLSTKRAKIRAMVVCGIYLYLSVFALLQRVIGYLLL